MALQIRLAITERLSLIATKDGFSWLDANVLPRERRDGTPLAAGTSTPSTSIAISISSPPAASAG